MNARQRAALQALMVCSTKAEAAKQAGIAERTLRSYFQDEEFVKEYDRLFGDLMDEVTRELQKSLPLAIRTLRAVCEDPEASWPAKSAAAHRLLDVAPEYVTQNNILQRLEKLERMG